MFFGLNPGLAQENKTPLRFDNYDPDHGLSQTNVTDIIEDQRGFMWIGTEDGLNVFDGSSFKIYRNDEDDENSISYNTIRSIIEDDNFSYFTNLPYKDINYL